METGIGRRNGLIAWHVAFDEQFSGCVVSCWGEQDGKVWSHWVLGPRVETIPHLLTSLWSAKATRLLDVAKTSPAAGRVTSRVWNLFSALHTTKLNMFLVKAGAVGSPWMKKNHLVCISALLCEKNEARMFYLTCCWRAGKETCLLRQKLTLIEFLIMGVVHVVFFQSAGDFARAAVLRGNRHVVVRLCDRGVVPGLAALPRLVRIRPDPLHRADAGPALRAHAQQRHQDAALLHPGKHRRQLQLLAAKGEVWPGVLLFSPLLVKPSLIFFFFLGGGRERRLKLFAKFRNFRSSWRSNEEEQKVKFVET